ncbi:protein lap4-like [Centruroides sculpturatus]|uniref:protein lap4-like n=1 Tax=Centruroides sculpturatus TaxID=218467 RepID=UPI000C6D5FCF|nr:protein lap4-like [Centruroides sculpturatus]
MMWSPFNFVHTINDFDIVFDKKLSFNNHINSLSKKLAILTENLHGELEQEKWEEIPQNRAYSVTFAEENEENDDKETRFIRHDTPHPRELKARHGKLFVQKGQNIDGHVIIPAKEKEVITTENFRPQRSSPVSSIVSEESLSHKKENKYGKKLRNYSIFT